MALNLCQSARLLSFCLFFKAVLSLDCYICSSDDSFESCDIKQTKETCQTRSKCGKLSFRLSEGNRFRKGCLSVIYCTDPDRYCRSITGATDCQVSCCSQDVCNSIAPATSRKLNWIPLFCCAVLPKLFSSHLLL